MAEKLTLTTPQTVTDFSIVSVHFHWRDSRIIVELIDTTGKLIFCTYEGAQATTLMIALNKANLTTLSLQKRIFNQLSADGKLPSGNVTGTPD